MNASSFWVSILVLLPLGIACGGESAMNSQVRTAAARELNCHESAIEFVDDRPFEKHVRGCGQELVYSRSCNGSRGANGCQWVADVPEAPSPTSAPAATAERVVEGETTVEAEKVGESDAE